MEKVTRTVLNILVILISVYLTDGGRSLSLVSDNIQNIIVHNHIGDIAIPHQQQVVSFNDDEKWPVLSVFDFLAFHPVPVLIPFDMNSPTKEFSDSIWQPPKIA
jgi:hypothetical protein